MKRAASSFNVKMRRFMAVPLLSLTSLSEVQRTQAHQTLCVLVASHGREYLADAVRMYASQSPQCDATLDQAGQRKGVSWTGKRKTFDEGLPWLRPLISRVLARRDQVAPGTMLEPFRDAYPRE